MKYGFVYIWFDRKHKRFYIGAHWGHEDDGYICSSAWMKRAYKLRVEDFRRRILVKIYTNRKDLHEEEHRWLQMIKENELKVKYYNLRNHHFGHWSANEELLEIKEKMSRAAEKRWQNPEYLKKMSKRDRSFMQTEEYKLKQSEDTKKRWDDLEYRKRTTNTMNKIMQTSEYKENMSKIVKERWQDLEFKVKTINKINEVFQTYEYKTKQSEITKERWEDPEFRKKMQVTCPHCSKSGKKGAMIRFHFNNCRQKI